MRAPVILTASELDWKRRAALGTAKRGAEHVCDTDGPHRDHGTAHAARMPRNWSARAHLPAIAEQGFSLRAVPRSPSFTC